MKGTAQLKPSAALLESVERSDPSNPFLTAAYCRARMAFGPEPVVFGPSNQDPERFTLGFLRTGRLRRSLELPSFGAPELSDAVLRFCRTYGITDLSLNTFACEAASVPRFPGETQRYRRREFVIDLEGADLWKGLGKGHRGSVRMAEKANMEIRCTRDAAACEQHVAAMSDSKRRRDDAAGAGPLYDAADFIPLLTTGAGELYQAVLDGEVVSSILALRSPTCAYDQSSGTTERGTSMGASAFLVFNTARSLAEAGVRCFNLGGARDSETGLISFKTRFGTRILEQEAVRCRPYGLIRRFLSPALGRLGGSAA